jgi:hypothetical protein
MPRLPTRAPAVSMPDALAPIFFPQSVRPQRSPARPQTDHDGSPSAPPAWPAARRPPPAAWPAGRPPPAVRRPPSAVRRPPPARRLARRPPAAWPAGRPPLGPPAARRLARRPLGCRPHGPPHSVPAASFAPNALFILRFEVVPLRPCRRVNPSGLNDVQLRLDACRPCTRSGSGRANVRRFRRFGPIFGGGAPGVVPDVGCVAQHAGRLLEAWVSCPDGETGAGHSGHRRAAGGRRGGGRLAGG